MAYDTLNPVGSSDPRDLFDNAHNLDDAANGDAYVWTDRFGRQRKSWAGIINDSDQFLSEKEQQFNEFLLTQGIQEIGEYEDGPYTLTGFNQAIKKGEYLYRLSTTQSLPYTTVGVTDEAWDEDKQNFIQINFVSQAQLDEVVFQYQKSDASLQAQISGMSPLPAQERAVVEWHDQIIPNSVSVPANKNAGSFGPDITLADGVSIFLGDNSHYTICYGEVQNG